MRQASMPPDVQPAALGLVDGEEVLAVGDFPLLDLLERMRGAVRFAVESFRNEGFEERQLRVLLTERTHRLLFLATPEDLELHEFFPLEGEAPHQVGTWCGAAVFLVQGELVGHCPLPMVQAMVCGPLHTCGVIGGEN